MRTIVRWLTICLIALFVGRAVAGDRPHLVVFISDDHSFLDASTAGAADLRTPQFERLAREGMSFTRAFAVSPSCAPSRAALLTGLMPLENGAMFNHQPPRKEVVKLPAYLKKLGYEVVAFGKVAHYKQGKDYGFDLVANDTFHDDACVAKAIEWLQRRESDKPLCLLVGTNWPHVPWPAAEPETDLSKLQLPPTHVDTPPTRRNRARYYAAVKRMDDDLGAVYDAAYRKLGSNTLFLHFSDHGAQWPFGKWNLYDAGLHVPLFAVWPGVIEEGSRCDELTTLLDVLPTLIEVAGGTPPPDLAGRSLLPLLNAAAIEPRKQIFATHSGDGRMNQYPVRAVRTQRWKYVRNLDPQAQHTTHIDKGQPVDGRGYWQTWEQRAEADPAAGAIVERYRHRPAEELYDLEADLHEQNNLAAEPQHAGMLAQLRSELDTWMAEQGDRGLETEKDAWAEFFPRQSKSQVAK